MARRLTTGPRRAPRQRRAEDTVAVLLEATKRVVAAEGIEGATTNRIAAVAGVGIGTVYRYFPTKEALVESLVQALWDEELLVVTTHARALEEQALEDAIPQLLGALVDVVKKHRPFYARLQTEMLRLGRRDLASEKLETVRQLFSVIMERRREELRAIDIPLASDLVVKMGIYMVRRAAYDHPAELESGSFVREFSRLFVRYLVKE